MKINNYKSFIIFLIMNIISVFTGCTRVQEFYLGDVEVNAPITPPPSHITIRQDSSVIKFSFKFLRFPNHREIRTSTDERYNAMIEFPDKTKYKASKDNLIWKISDNILGMDLDIRLGRKVSLFGGIHFPTKKEQSHVGGNFGIGFHSYRTSPATRIDIGFGFQKYDYQAVTIVKTTESSFWSDSKYYIDIFNDKGSKTNINPFVTLTINSAVPQNLINYYITIGYFTQNLLGYRPGETHYFSPLLFFCSSTVIDQRSDCTCGFFYMNPGLLLSINRQTNLLFSAKVLRETLATGMGDWFIVPSLQIDFLF